MSGWDRSKKASNTPSTTTTGCGCSTPDELTPLPCYLGAFRQHPESKTATRGDLFRRYMRRLYRRFGLGRNEEEVQSQLGEEWPLRLALIEDLCETPAFDHGGLALAFLRLLERPRWSARAVSTAGIGLVVPAVRAARPPLALGGLGAPRRDPPVADSRRPSTPPTIQSPRRGQAHRSGGRGAGRRRAHRGRPGGGGGGSFVEKSADHVYRWADNDAEIVITRPSGERRRLVVEIESGPSLDCVRSRSRSWTRTAKSSIDRPSRPATSFAASYP